MPFWVIVFGALQFVVGVMLVLGWRTRLAALLGLAYLGGLGVMGFTRYAPFAYALLVAVLALDGGRVLGFDSSRALARHARYGLPIPRRAVGILIAVSVVNAVAAATAVVVSGGIAPDGYTESMGQMTTGMVALFSGMFALIGWLQLQSGGPEQEVTANAHRRTPREWITELTSA